MERLALGEALLIGGDPDIVAWLIAHKSDGVRTPLRWLGGEDPTTDRYVAYRQRQQPLEGELLKRLRAGDLIATGLQSPLTGTTGRQKIPADLWKVLESDFERSEAHADGLRFIRIEVQVATTAHQPDETRAIDEHLAIWLSDDGGTLKVGRDVLMLRGRIQPALIRRLLDANSSQQRLRTKDLLDQVNSGAGTLAKAFRRSRAWPLLKPYLRQANGHSWFEF